MTSSCEHRIVRNLTATLEESVSERRRALRERGVCAHCGNAVERITVIRDQGHWGAKHGEPVPDDLVYLCVAVRRQSA